MSVNRVQMARDRPVSDRSSTLSLPGPSPAFRHSYRETPGAAVRWVWVTRGRVSKRVLAAGNAAVYDALQAPTITILG